MPFWAIVEAHTGDILDVVEELDGDLPPGAIAIDLPAREDDIRSWLAQHRKKRAGGGGRDLSMGPVEEQAGGRETRGEGLGDAEQFFTRLRLDLLRAEADGHPLSVLLFDLSPMDRDGTLDFVVEALDRHGQELLPCDLAAQLREHLVGVVMPEIDVSDARISVTRGAVACLVYPRDRDAVTLLARRRHPWLQKSSMRRSA